MPRQAWNTLVLFTLVGIGFGALGILVDKHFWYLTAICAIVDVGIFQVVEEEKRKRQSNGKVQED